MSVWRLILCEIAYRRLPFALALLAVAAAVGSVAAITAALRAYDVHTEQLIAERQAQVDDDMRRLEDEYRKITKDLGFNLRILHADQDPAELYRNHYATHYLPDDYADKLARAKVVTVNHLLPILHEYVLWQELGQQVHVVGTRGEIPIVGADKKKPLLEAVPKNGIVLGAAVAKQLKKKAGEQVAFNGKPLTIKRVRDAEGTENDITVWMNLAQAQDLLGKPGKINAILALECNCEADRVDRVREEIASVLPNTQVVELSVIAEGRARARNEAKATARAQVAKVKKEREDLRAGRTSLAAVLLPVVLLASTLWLGGLTFGNVRDRRGEIGILRAVGVPAWKVAALVLGRALLVGLAGAVLGYAAGLVLGGLWADDGAGFEWPEIGWEAALLAAAPLWCAVCALMPALLAARQDPAAVLTEP
jgi:hypothetical protein